MIDLLSRNQNHAKIFLYDVRIIKLAREIRNNNPTINVLYKIDSIGYYNNCIAYQVYQILRILSFISISKIQWKNVSRQLFGSIQILTNVYTWCYTIYYTSCLYSSTNNVQLNHPAVFNLATLERANTSSGRLANSANIMPGEFHVGPATVTSHHW